MERQTKLSFEEICECLEQNRRMSVCGACHGGTLPYPPCLLVNELGVIAADEGSKEAEAKLRDILGWPQKELCGYAYMYLTQMEHPDNETMNAMLAFAQKPENEEIMELVNEELNKRNGIN